MGYLLYGGISFGLTEFLKRRFVELAGPDLAALYPIPILLGARCEAQGRARLVCLSCGSGACARVFGAISSFVPHFVSHVRMRGTTGPSSRRKFVCLWGKSCTRGAKINQQHESAVTTKHVSFFLQHAKPSKPPRWSQELLPCHTSHY